MLVQPQEVTTRVEDLIYDIGMHQGEDTDFYLKKGFRVIAFEANPDLVEQNRKRFADEINDKKLTIVEGAIVEDCQTGKIPFYKNLVHTIWGTIDSNWVLRNEQLGTQHQLIEVDAVNFEQCIRQYGIPYYMKIDIEGADLVCLKTLLKFNIQPRYLSIESDKVSIDRVYEEIDLMRSLGYKEFLAVQQEDMDRTKVPYPPKEGQYVHHQFQRGASGLFGKELANNWKSEREILNEYNQIFLNYKRYGDRTSWQQNKLAKLMLRAISKISRRSIPGWYDTHARLS